MVLSLNLCAQVRDNEASLKEAAAEAVKEHILGAAAAQAKQAHPHGPLQVSQHLKPHVGLQVLRF